METIATFTQPVQGGKASPLLYLTILKGANTGGGGVALLSLPLKVQVVTGLRRRHIQKWSETDAEAGVLHVTPVILEQRRAV